MPTILIADDNSNIQKMVALAFKGEGIDVVMVGNGEAAVRKAAEIMPDLVLADIFMPVRNGYEVCEFLKQNERFSHIPVVLLAGAFDPFDEREAQRVGADGVLKKPFVPPDPLVTLVKSLLARNSERLVAVSMPAQSTVAPAQSSSQASAASPMSASAVVAPPFIPAPVAPTASAPQFEESIEDDMDATTSIPPMRDFSIAPAEVEAEHDGGADAFGSMLATAEIESAVPAMEIPNEPASKAGHDVQPASIHSAFEGFSPWRAAGSVAPITESEELVEPASQPATLDKEMIGRVWEIDPALSESSPDETVIESRERLSPLTHSAQHITTVRDEVAPVSEAAQEKPDASAKPAVADWRDAFRRAPEPPIKSAESAPVSMSPWNLPTATKEIFPSENSDEHARTADEPVDAQPAPAGEISAADAIRDVFDDAPAALVPTELDQPAQEQSAAAPNHSSEYDAAVEVAQPLSPSTFPSAESTDWISNFPAQLNPEDTTEIARSLIAGLAPSVVESEANSFPVPTGKHADPQVIEDIVARVVQRMQPQILEIITREVLRPVVEALVRRQLEEKLPE